MSEKTPAIYCCCPTYAQPEKATAKQFWARGNDPRGKYVHLTRIMDDQGGSLLANAFNVHWCAALNLQRGGVDLRWFIMLHADVIPQDWWIDQLLIDLEESGADLMAAVVPIKDSRGITSTAIDDPADPWCVLRRLTMTEVHALPELFSAADCGYPDNYLLPNTGCWVARFDRPWRFRVHFEINDRIIFKTTSGRSFPPQCAAPEYISEEELKEGGFVAETMSEDWNFGRQLGALGAKVMCTRRVALRHAGGITYPNTEPWGDFKSDDNLARKHGGKPIGGIVLPARPETTISKVTFDDNGYFRDAEVTVRKENGDGTVKATVRLLSWPSEELPDVDGLITDEEGRALARLAAGRDVLEIGSWKGRSTIWMARTARSVVAVDTFDGRGTFDVVDIDTFDEFAANLKRYGVDEKVGVLNGESVFWMGQLRETHQFDLIFIDGSHDYESVKADAEAALLVLRDGGLLVFHDYQSTADPGVTQAVDELLAGGAGLVEKVGQLAVVLPARREAAACR